MAEPFALDDPPAADPSNLGGEDDGKVQCPECPNRYKSSGLQRHITMAHRDGISDSAASPNRANKPKSTMVIQTRWAEFQRGAALLVSLACSQCAAVLSEDAEKDAIALAHFCEHKPKLRKQVEQFLSTADFMLLLGAFGGTAQKMVAHHSIGKRIPGVLPVENTDHGHNPMEKAMAFMDQMPPEARHQMMDNVFAQHRQQQEAQEQRQEEEAAVASYPGAVGGYGAGAEPVPESVELTEHDRAIREAMGTGAVFMETAGNLIG